MSRSQLTTFQWSLEHTYRPEDIQALSCLSWGLRGEVLIGGSKLVLLTTDSECREYWKSRELANNTKLASFSHDASLVASTAWYDRLIKIWRRGFIGDGNERFDPVYLAHPDIVTSLRWRNRPRTEEHADAVLYTTCADGYLRVWIATDPHCLHILDLWTEIDLITSIQPRSPLSPSPFKKRYVVIIDKWNFQQAVAEASDRNLKGEREQHTSQRLLEIASNEPEVCIVLDDRGNMSAWGLERVGCKARVENDVINIGHAENLQTSFSCDPTADEDFAVFRAFVNAQSKGSLHVLAHLFDGRLQWLSSPVEQLFDPCPPVECFQLEAELTGNSTSTQSLTTSITKEYILSASESGEFVLWRQREDSGHIFGRHSIFQSSSACLDAKLLLNGEYALILHEDKVCGWDVRRPKGSQIACVRIQAQPDWKLCVPQSFDNTSAQCCIASRGKQIRCVTFRIQHDGVDLFIETDGMLFENGLPRDKQADEHPSNDDNYIVVTDQTHPSSLMGIDKAGRMEISSQSPNNTNKCRSCSTRSSIGNLRTPEHAAFSFDLVAFVEGHGSIITIWNLLSDLCEYVYSFPAHQTVTSMRWTRFTLDSPALAVAFTHRVVGFVPVRGQFHSRTGCWRPIFDLSIIHMTNIPITDVVWTANEDVLIAAGNQMFGFDTASFSELESFTFLPQQCSAKTPVRASQHACAALSTQPTYSPHSIFQRVLSDELESVEKLFRILYQRMKYYSEGDSLDSDLGCADLTGHGNVSYRALNNDHEDEKLLASSDSSSLQPHLSMDEAHGLCESFANAQLPWISPPDQILLEAFTHCISRVNQFVSSTDAFGLRYLFSLFLPRAARSPEIFDLNPWRSTVYAYLSGTQDILLDTTTRFYSQNLTISWSSARRHHTCLYITSRESLLAHFETIARAEYTKTDERDPLDCSLFYLALHKKQVLQGLWRMATWHRERDATMRVLAHNFEESRWRTAALKNAYTLLGKRRSMYAAAWFLLADEGRSAVGVLAGEEVNDLELALSVARVYDGDDGEVLKGLIEDRVLPKAVTEGNRWMAIWACLMLKREDLALRVMLVPLQEAIPNAPKEVPLEAKMWYNEDPSIVWVYQHLRDEILKRPVGKRVPLPNIQEETRGVLQSARMYMRMGCGWLALQLLREWKFVPDQRDLQQRTEKVNGGFDTQGVNDETRVDGPPSMLDAFESFPASQIPTGDEKSKVMEEPSVSSILDNFDF